MRKRQDQQKVEETQDLGLELEGEVAAEAKEAVEEDAEVVADEEIRCECIRCCVWNGYHDEGDIVRLRRSDLDDPFVESHFKII